MVTLLSIPLGWVGWELDQRRKEKAAIAWVKEMGGTFHFVSGGPFSPDVPLTRSRSWSEKTKDNWFGERVRIVSLLDTQVCVLSPLAELKNLEFLDLKYTLLSEGRLKELRRALPNCKIQYW